MNELTTEWIAKAEGDYAVRYRYPGESADIDEARAALRATKVVRTTLRQRLGLQG